MSSTTFAEAHVLHQLKHYLPSQTPLKDFIHHNSLHAFQDMKFYDAIFKASKVFGYQVTLQLAEYRELYRIGRISKAVLENVVVQQHGLDNKDEWMDRLLNRQYDLSNHPRIGQLREQWKTRYALDLDNQVQPLLFRILCSYLDQGIGLWKFPGAQLGFLDALRELEKNALASFFHSPRVKKLLFDESLQVKDLLQIVVGDEAYFEQYIFDQQFSHRGWSGMVSTVEDVPGSLMEMKQISLRDLLIFELLLEIDALDENLGKNWQPLASSLDQPPLELLAPVPPTELHEVFILWQNAFEWSYYDEVLAGIRQLQQRAATKPVDTSIPSFQAMFCIDERECSLRRHLEATDPACETLGSPGFFGVEFYIQPEGAKFYDKLCPAPVTPKYLIKEYDVPGKRKHELLYNGKTHTLLRGSLGTLALGFVAGIKLLQTIFRPKMSPAISNAFAHMHVKGKLTIENKDTSDIENGLQVGFTVDEMTVRVEGVLKSTGLIANFSPLVYIVAHGSSSANNPHHGAHDCGACSGRPGSANARVFAFMANHPQVRTALATKGIDIPATTQFVGSLHDTAADQVEFYDEEAISAINTPLHLKNKQVFETALDLNAKERSRRFASINTKSSLKHVRKEILKRSVSMFEPRPELGHGTNTLCIIGRRSITRGLFLDRRAFLNSYDHRTDPEGKLLTGLMRPIGPVCGGINLEYYFSRVDNYKLGAGTKLPHNVMGLIGVANSSDGDLRPGLPLQMIEVHDPVRLMVIVEHYPEVVLAAIQSAPEMYEWYNNEWVHLAVVHPGTGAFHYFNNGAFKEYQPISGSVDSIGCQQELVEKATEMETNNIVDATRENLPVYTLN